MYMLLVMTVLKFSPRNCASGKYICFCVCGHAVSEIRKLYSCAFQTFVE